MTLTPLSSNESLPEHSFIPSFIKSNWVRSFQVPWSRMPAALTQATSTGERARPGPRREFVRIVVAAMQAHCPNPNLATCGEVARNIVSKYPLTFGDISDEGEQLGNGFSCLQRQLKTRVEHVNRDVMEHRIRRPRRPSEKRPGQQDNYMRTKVRCKVDSYGCINWQPSSIPIGETAESLEMKRKVAAEIFQSAGPKAAELPNVDDLMQQTYVFQRHMINSCPPPTISEIEGHWPFLFTERGLCRHFKILTGIDIRSRFNETIIVKSKRILNYFNRQRLKCNAEIQSMLNEIDDTNATDNTRIAMSAILLMMKYFKEKDNAVFILADVSIYEILQFYLSFEGFFDMAWVLKCFCVLHSRKTLPRRPLKMKLAYRQLPVSLCLVRHCYTINGRFFTWTYIYSHFSYFRRDIADFIQVVCQYWGQGNTFHRWPAGLCSGIVCVLWVLLRF